LKPPTQENVKDKKGENREREKDILKIVKKHHHHHPSPAPPNLYDVMDRESKAASKRY
jgi:hypothetical protein